MTRVGSSLLEQTIFLGFRALESVAMWSATDEYTENHVSLPRTEMTSKAFCSNFSVDFVVDYSYC
jgi:hypothetical protein